MTTLETKHGAEQIFQEFSHVMRQNREGTQFVIPPRHFHLSKVAGLGKWAAAPLSGPDKKLFFYLTVF